MILLDVALDHIYGFREFHMNFSYPKKIVHSIVDEEWLAGRPKFRYKKAVILMGANATGKTSLGKALLNIFSFIDSFGAIENTAPEALANMVRMGKTGTFSVDFVNEGNVLHRVAGKITPLDRSDSLKSMNMELRYAKTAIGTKDTYETCANRLTGTEKPMGYDSYLDMRDSIGKINYIFSCPEVKPSARIANVEKSHTLKVLRAVIGTLDPTLRDISVSSDLRNSFIIRRGEEEIIIQDGKLLNREALSSGTSEGVDIAFFLALLLKGENGFYYCDEHFSYIQSDIEKRIFGLMLDNLAPGEQLIFTTHNADMLDLNMPKHSFAFLRKEKEAPYKISAAFASNFLKRNTDSVHCALENDLFQSIPDDTLLNILERGYHNEK